MAATKRSQAQRQMREAGNQAAVRVTHPVGQPPDPAGDFLKSKIFAAPEGTFKDALDWSKLTVGGKPIPDHLHGLIAYDLTDQAAEERLAKRTHEPSGIEFGADPVDKSVQKYADGLRDDIDQWANPDPLRELANRHVQPGERYRFLSPKKIDRAGLRGWEPKVAEVDGVKKIVSTGGMILGTMPEARAKSREKFFANKASEAMLKASDDEREQTEKAVDLTLGRRKRSQAVDKGFESFRGDPAEMNDADFSLVGLDRDK